MKAFSEREVAAAKAHALAGGQALHLHRIIANPRTAPQVFKRAVARGEAIAHLFDADRGRLETTARRLGVRVVRVEHPGTPRQHVDLCGGPLRRACIECVNAVEALALFVQQGATDGDPS